MSFPSFHFSAEELKGAQGGAITAVPDRDELATDSYLWGGSKIQSSNDGDCWKPADKSVVSTDASTWACFCWPCVAPCAGLCWSPVETFGHNWFYRQRLKRAQWIYLCNGLAFLVHAFMAWLSYTACGSTTWPHDNPNCTAKSMEVPVYRCAHPPHSPHTPRLTAVPSTVCVQIGPREMPTDTR